MTDVVAGELVDIAPGVRRLTAPNPGMMTGPGTNSYIVGDTELAVIDPGPVIPSHIDQLAAVGDVRWIIATHTHPDHSPACAHLAAQTGAELIGVPAPDGPHQDKTFMPARVPRHGDKLAGSGFELKLLHTPGHASNHFCVLHLDFGMLFTGDHVMNGSTVIIDPPDGNMNDYLMSLRMLMDEPLQSIAPGHGAVIDEPIPAINWIIEHRLEREQKIAAKLSDHPGSTSEELVPFAYDEVPANLYELAERSLLAHLQKLQEDGRARRDNERWWMVGNA